MTKRISELLNYRHQQRVMRNLILIKRVTTCLIDVLQMTQVVTFVQ